MLIAPDLGDISAATFDRSADAIRIGEEATRAMADSLKRYSLPPEQYAALRATQVAERKALGTVDEIRVEGLERTNPEVLRALVESKPGEPLSEEKIGADLRRIYGRGGFESISYHIAGDGGPRAMVIEPKEKSWGPDYLRFGLGLASDFQGDNQFNLLVQYRKTWLNRLGGEWLTEVQVGQNTHPVHRVLPAAERGGPAGSSRPMSRSGRRRAASSSATTRSPTTWCARGQVGLDVGAVLGTWGQLRARPRVVARRRAASTRARPSCRRSRRPRRAPGGAVRRPDRPCLLPDPRLRRRRPRPMRRWSRSDRRRTTSGSKGRVRGAQSWGPHTLGYAVSGGTDLGSDMPAYESFTLGGPLRLSGYRINQFAGREYRVRPPDVLQPHAAAAGPPGSGVYVGGSAEVGRITDRFDGLPSPGTLWSGSVFLGADTFAGPAYLGVGFGEATGPLPAARRAVAGRAAFRVARRRATAAPRSSAGTPSRTR